MKAWVFSAAIALWMAGPAAGQSAGPARREKRVVIKPVPKARVVSDDDLRYPLDYDAQYTKREGGRWVTYLKATGQPLDGSYEICMSSSVAVRDLVYPTTTLCTSGRYRRGLSEGRWTLVDYEADGAKEVMYYRHGMLHGPYVVVDSAGRALYRTRFVNGTGYSKSFYRGGRLREEGYLRQDQMHGRWVTYDRAGRVTKAAVYQDGALRYTEPVLP